MALMALNWPVQGHLSLTLGKELKEGITASLSDIHSFTTEMGIMQNKYVILFLFTLLFHKIEYIL